MLLGEEGCFSVVLLGECPSDNEIVVVVCTVSIVLVCAFIRNLQPGDFCSNAMCSRS